MRFVDDFGTHVGATAESDSHCTLFNPFHQNHTKQQKMQRNRRICIK